MTATTALTAQNTLGVQDIHHTPPEFLQKQIDAVCSDVGVDVVKTGTSCNTPLLPGPLTVCRYVGIRKFN
jgi:hydroxymethylpyrimidine/phosphomethylpyrimidine kinase